jgi:hypothetical protein
MKNLLLLLILFTCNVNAQLRQQQDDGFAGITGSSNGGLVIVALIVILVLIFGGSGGRSVVLFFTMIFGLPLGFALLGNNIFPEPKLGGDLSLAGFIGFFLGLYLFYKSFDWFEKKD